MDLNLIQDLIPHKASLSELYKGEEFQVLLNFLSSIRKQKEAEIFSMQGAITSDDEKVRTNFGPKIAMAIIQRNTIAMIENLPSVVASIEEQAELQKAAQAAFKEAQKGVTS